MKPSKAANASFDSKSALDKLAKNSDDILSKNQTAHKSTKVMETELKSL